MATTLFQKATKRAAKARVALDGPSGSGKTWTALEWATVLGKRVAVLDTERGSASLYSDTFDFDVLEMTPPFDPQRAVDAFRTAESDGYDVFVLDSLSHFWEGEGGVLEIVDGAAQRSGGNSFAGWKVGTPAYRHLIDTMLAADLHVIATMRSKTEWVLEENAKGKKEPKRVGMAVVQRAGIEYEFTLVGDLDLEHRVTISKSRCELLSDNVLQPGRAGEGAETFRRWLEAGEPVASRVDVDALVGAMNALPADTRLSAKQTFVERFGRPEHLLASRVEEARQFVDEFIGGDEAGKPLTDEAAAEQPKESLRTAAKKRKEVDANADFKRTANKLRDYIEAMDDDAKAIALSHAKRAEIPNIDGPHFTPEHAAVLWPLLRMGRALSACNAVGVTTDDARHELVREATGGATESTKDLSEAQLAAILDYCTGLAALDEGRPFEDGVA